MVEDDRGLMKSIMESQEVKQQFLQIAAANEEQKRKGFFSGCLDNKANRYFFHFSNF